jgi:UDPglucose--hexose-1-phosphate uridylyltransferase
MHNTAFFTKPHRRLNLLTGEWLLVSPHRTQRPWQGQVEDTPPDTRPEFDPTCYLCPGNTRAGGVVNPHYSHTFVFENDYAALLPNTEADEYLLGVDGSSNGPLLVAQTERGICRVICFSPRHDLTLAGMDVADLRQVVNTWVEQYEELGAIPWVTHVQIFENRGAMMGASNPHPHGQIWANERIPNESSKEIKQQREYLAQNGRTLLGDYLELELKLGERIVCSNDHFVSLVPFWAVWPFETLVIPREHRGSVSDLTPDERDGLADILRQTTRRYDRLFNVSFPYSMGIHQRPTDGEAYPELRMHAHFYPPLLRSATVRKFMVGYEMLGQAQRDITPESAAERLRSLGE